MLPVIGLTQIVSPLGQTPPALRWKQIHTRHFRIVFPQEIEKDAQRIANAMENSYYDDAASLKYLPSKMPIVMQNQTTDNNAFVTPEGRRAEFFSTPPQNPNNMGLNNWYDELSLHEYRHVVQTDQTRIGWGKFLYYLFGNSGTAITQGLTNPWWFWEGDAVGCETALGYGGRGRIPSFDITFRTQLLSRGAFSYTKAACGSMKNAIPNHYLLGYLMTTYAKNHFGADVWSKVLTRTYKKPPLPFSFSNNVKKITGLNVEQMYTAMTEEVKQMWKQQTDTMMETPATYFHHSRSQLFVNYKFPQYLEDGSIVVQKAGLETGSFLAYKSSIVDQSQFVQLTPGGEEKRIRISGVLDDNGMMSASGNKVVWSEYSYDPRWGARNYTVIKILDTRTRKIKQLTRHSRLHAPCLSPDGSRVAAIESTTDNKVFLCLFDAATGQMIKRYDNPGNRFYLQPHFTDDGRGIVMVVSVPGFKGIVKLDLESGLTHTVLPPVAENLSAPVEFGKYILYNSTRSGIDNIYAVDTATRQQFQVTNRKYGAFNPCISPDHRSIAFQDFTPDGFRVAVMPALPAQWRNINPGDTALATKTEYFETFARQEAGNILARIPDSVYPVSTYRRLKNAVNVYSWGIDPLTNWPKWSIGVRSLDLLSTTELAAGFRYDNKDRRWGKYFKVTYSGLYPQLFFGYADGKRKTILSSGQADTSGIHYDLVGFTDLDLGVKIPLNLSGGPFIRKLNLTAQGVYTRLNQLYYRSDGKRFDKIRLGEMYSLKYDLLFDMHLRPGIRDVAPRFGSLVQLSYIHTPFHSFFEATQTAVDAQFYVPGFFKHHAILLRANWQQDATSNYHLENRYDFVRNLRDELFHDLQIWSIDYKLPICYPDAKVLKGVLYFQRIKAGLFTELGIGRPAHESEVNPIKRYNNTGVELTADVNFMRFLLPLEAGIRTSYLQQTHSIRQGFILRAPLF
jgi:hypothetical protein